MTDERKPPLKPLPGLKLRATTHGDRNEDRRRVLTPPRGVGLTEPPATIIETTRKRDRDDEDITAKIGLEPELAHVRAAARAELDPEERIAKLEVKSDRQALLADRLISNKWKRDLIDRIVTALIALATGYVGYLIGSR